MSAGGGLHIDWACSRTPTGLTRFRVTCLGCNKSYVTVGTRSMIQTRSGCCSCAAKAREGKRTHAQRSARAILGWARRRKAASRA